jgi:hypothetical protein
MNESILGVEPLNGSDHMCDFQGVQVKLEEKYNTSANTSAIKSFKVKTKYKRCGRRKGKYDNTDTGLL